MTFLVTTLNIKEEIMKKHLLLALILILAIAGIQQTPSVSSTYVYAAQAQTDEDMANLLKGSQYANQALKEMQQGKFNEAYKTFDEAFKYLDLFEKKLVATPNYPDRANLLNKTRMSKATIYALKGKLEIEYYKQNTKGIANLKKALELHPQKSAETLLAYANLAIQQGYPSVAKIYVDQVLSAKNIPAKYISIANSLKAKL